MEVHTVSSSNRPAGRSRWSERKRKIGVRILDRDNADLLDDHHLLCCWDTCDNYASSLYKVRVDESTAVQTKIVWYTFCRDRCRQYWINSTRDLYNLPPGMRLSVQ